MFQKRFSIATALSRIVLLNRAATHEGQMGRTLSPASLDEWIFLGDALAAGWVFDRAQHLGSTDPTVAFQGIRLSLAPQSLLERSLMGFTPPEVVPAAERIKRVSEFFSLQKLPFTPLRFQRLGSLGLQLSS